tara:strand:+ start:2218 stop:3474 length:1257 start_codon:yes stop_codon:yes gene_type:complete
MSFEVVKYLYKEQRRFYERKKLYMHQAFNKDLVEGFSRSRRLINTPDTNFDPQPFRYRCQATEDGFIIVFEKLEDAKLYSRIVKFRGFTESYESDWELKTGWEYPLDDFKLTPSEYAKMFTGISIDNEYFDDKMLFDKITERFQETNTLKPSVNHTGRNLVYFTLGVDEKFTRMVKSCIWSILQNTREVVFDILIIHDSGVAVSEFCKIFPEVQFHFLEVEKAKDGIEASMNKLKLFSFLKITEYKNVLFLDADIVFGKVDIRDVFGLSLSTRTFYSVVHSTCLVEMHQTFFHTIRRYEKNEMVKFEEANLVPFNAGQFMFTISNVMQRHFENILYLISVWRKNYFFEQSFMNYYFNSNMVSDTDLMKKYFSIYYIGKDHMANLTLNKEKVVHYAGDPCDGSSKLDFLKENFPEYYEE